MKQRAAFITFEEFSFGKIYKKQQTKALHTAQSYK